MNGPQIKFLTVEEEAAIAGNFFRREKILRAERNAASVEAKDSLPLLITACAGKTGQSYKLRTLLFSLWNGKPASLTEVVTLDWELQKALSNVIRAFGSDLFFYDQIFEAFDQARLIEWFLEEGRK